jgi:DNA-binding NarL/FixJ family response regulator
MVDVWIMAPSAARREVLSNCFGSGSDIRVAGMAGTFPFLRSLMADTTADVALIELQPESQSTTVHDWLNELLELTPIVFLCPGPDLAIFNSIRRMGTGGLLQANASCEQIVQALKSVGAGLTVFDSTLAPQSTGEESAAEELTPREGEVLRLLGDGLGNKEIAAKLGISEHTIKFHIRSILGKLGAASRTEAVARGLRSGLIEL